jgi:hypothetical protein
MVAPNQAWQGKVEVMIINKITFSSPINGLEIGVWYIISSINI